ncbi:MAG: calcium-binding protein, partial [Pseudomonadota bacterium]|nr:calcium-binding protein [Pseudomonadota bacterium]
YGEAGNDVINGGNGNDLLDGGDDDDVIAGGGGHDVIFGGQGADQLAGNDGNDRIEGGEGADTLIGGAGDDVLLGGAGDDLLIGDAHDVSHASDGNDVLMGGDGNDKVIGRGGNDLLLGGAGDDLMTGDDGDDRLLGEDGDDELQGGNGDDVIDGGSGSDRLFGDAGNDVLYGGDGADELQGGDGDDHLEGGKGHDTLFGDAGRDVLIGGEGNDKLYGGADDDRLSGGNGDDELAGDDGADLLEGGSGNDTLDGGAGNDILYGDDGDDTIDGDEGDDLIYAGSGDDDVYGGEGNDRIYGGDGSDAINGAEGDDLIEGGNGDDILWGGAGNDFLYGGEGADRIFGGHGNDLISGGGGNDYLDGGEGFNTYKVGIGTGNDYIASLSGPVSAGAIVGGDLLISGGIKPTDLRFAVSGPSLKVFYADDSVIIQNFFLQGIQGSGAFSPNISPVTSITFEDGTRWGINDVKTALIRSTPAADRIIGFDEGETISGGEGDDYINGMGGDDILSGDGGNDELHGDIGNDVLSGGDGNDRLYGESGDDTLLGDAGDDQLSAGEGNDTLDGGDGDDTLHGEAGDDVLLGGAGNDSLFGGEGNDILDGGAGNDQLSGGRGNNRYLFGVGDGQDVILMEYDSTVGKSNTLVFKAGIAANDIVLRQIHSDFASSHLEVSIAGTSDKITIQKFISNDTINHAGNPIQRFEFADGTVWTLDQILAQLFAGTAADDVLQGTSADDVINGAGGNDRIWGGVGADTLNGGDGDDWLDGGEGDDILDGGAGNDRMIGGTGQNTFRFGRGDGQDIILDNLYYGPGSFNTLELKAGIAPGDLTMLQVAFLHPSSRVDLRIGIAGTNDFITIQKFFGGDRDPANISNPVQQIRFADGTLWTTQDILNRLFAGTPGDDQLEGTDRDDVIHGGDGNDTLSGMAGNDILRGGAGNDVLDGGAGADQLFGGQGDDLYRVDDAADTVTELANEGTDTIESSVSYTLPDHVEVLKLIGNSAINATGNAGDNTLIGNAASNVLTGGAGNDVLDGGGGRDTLIGGTGNDTYHVDDMDDVIVEQADEGYDTVYATYDYRLSGHIEKLVLNGWAQNGTGNALDNELIGNDADNRLDGGAGADRMVGGLGNDTYVVDNMGDVVVEDVDGGWDSVESSIDYTLGDTLEGLGLVGTAHLNGTGNAGDNQLMGNSGNNRLDGGAGADEMAGGEGDDYYITDQLGDQVYEEADEGIDTIERHFETNYILSRNVENLILAAGVKTGFGNLLDNVITGNDGDNTLGGLAGDDTLIGGLGNDSLFGDVGADILYGGLGNDYLDGGSGIDYMEGGAGDDSYIVDDSNDVVVEALNGGSDSVQASASYALSANIENLFLTGNAAINGSGNGLDNYIAGNAVDNIIHGGAGSDTIVAGGGNDTLFGDAGDDKYVFDANSGYDVVDNTGGGNDGIFFINGVTRERLSFSRDGNDLLIKIDASATPAVRVTNHFLGGDYAIDYVQPDGGYMLSAAQINQLVAGGGAPGFDQTIEGTANGEQLMGGAGKDMIRGLGGDDTIFGMAGDDTLQGGDGNDYLAGGNGNGTGSGNDRLEGGSGNDTLVGEDGSDTLIGGAGDDTYIYTSGQDVIDNSGGGNDGLFFQNGITESQLGFTRAGDDLLITVNGNAANTVRVSNHFLGGDYALDYLQPATGAMLTTAQINAKVGGGTTTPPIGGGTAPSQGNDADYPNKKNGTAAGEQIAGTSGRDLINGLAGNDTLFGMGGDDKLVGGDGDDYLSGGNGSFTGSGNDILIGGNGNDTLMGEDGNDTMFGGAGDDKYVFGGGADVIDNSGGGTDWLLFNSSKQSINRSRLSFHRDGDDLIVRVDGNANQQVRVYKHFDASGAYAIDYIQPADGYGIAASSIPAMLTPLPGTEGAALRASSLTGGWMAQASAMEMQNQAPVAASSVAQGVARNGRWKDFIADQPAEANGLQPALPPNEGPSIRSPWDLSEVPIYSPGYPSEWDNGESMPLDGLVLPRMEMAPPTLGEDHSMRDEAAGNVALFGEIAPALPNRQVVDATRRDGSTMAVSAELQHLIDAMANHDVGQAAVDHVLAAEPALHDTLSRQFHADIGHRRLHAVQMM